MPPGFMNAITGVSPPVTTEGSASWASAIRSPSWLSPAAFWVRVTSSVTEPTTSLAMGVTSSL